MAEAAGLVLAVAGLIGPAYTSINEIWEACRVMSKYRQDVLEHWDELMVLRARFETLMHFFVHDLENSPDLDDENDSVTKTIMRLLRRLHLRLDVCCKILAKAQSPESRRRTSSQSSAELSSPNHRAMTKASGYHIHAPFYQSKDAYSISSGLSQCLRIQSPSSALRDLNKGHAWPQAHLQGSKESNGTRNPTNIRNKIAWAHHDLKDLQSAKASIRDVVNDLQGVVTLRRLKEPHKLLPKAEAERTPQEQPRVVKEFYSLVHRALREANKRSKKPVRFAISALEELEENWNMLDNDTTLRLRSGSVALWLQMHVSDENSTFVVAEVQHTETRAVRHSIALSPLENLDLLPHMAQPQSAEPYLEWGALSNKSDPEDKIHLFARQGLWRRQKTLRDILAADHLCANLSKPDIVDLCRTILVAHHNLSEVRAATTNLGLDSYVFYQTDSDPAHNAGLDINCLYLHFGYGQQLDGSRKLGAMKSSFKSRDASIVELGLVLAQVASRTLIPYAPLEAAKIDSKTKSLVKRALPDIDVQFGDGVSTIIEACIEGTSRTEAETVVRAIETLEILRDRL